MKKLLILEIDEPVEIHKFKIGDKVKIEGVGVNIHSDYTKIVGLILR